MLEFDAQGVSTGEARAVSDRIRAKLGESGVLAVVERSRMSDILEEQGFQLSGVCDTDECVVQVGKILGVRHMVAGSVGIFGGYYIIQVRILNVETGRIEAMVTTEAGNLRQLVTQGVASIASRVEAEATDASVIAAGDEPGILESELLVAVLDVEAPDLQETEALAISDRIRIKLFQTGVFNIIERKKMDQLLEEQGFQLSGACNTEECAIQVGRVLGVHHIIIGNIHQFSGFYTLTLRVVNVESGRIEVISTADAATKLGLFSNATSILSETIALEVARQLGLDTTHLNLRKPNEDARTTVATAPVEIAVYPRLQYFSMLKGDRQNSLLGWEDTAYYDYSGNGYASSGGMLLSLQIGIRLNRSIELLADFFEYRSFVYKDAQLDNVGMFLPWSTSGLGLGARYSFLEDLLYCVVGYRVLEQVHLMTDQTDSNHYTWSDVLHDSGYFKSLRPRGFNLGFGLQARISPYLSIGAGIEYSQESAKSNYERLLFQRLCGGIYLRYAPASRIVL